MDYRAASNKKQYLLTIENPRELNYIAEESSRNLVGAYILGDMVKQAETAFMLPVSIEVSNFRATRIARHLAKPLRNEKAAARLARLLDMDADEVVKASHDFLIKKNEGEV
jgi:hypothetical protein